MTSTTATLISKSYNTDHATTAVLTFREDGWFNMTKAAKAFGKRLQHFMDNQETKEYMTALLTNRNSGELTETKMGRQGGIWVHPKLAVFFARWLDTKFAVWCDARKAAKEVV